VIATSTRLARHVVTVLGLLAAAAPARAQVPAPTPSAPPPATVVTAAGVLVDFQDADLRYVITALAEVAGMNVVYGELPPKRITLRLRQPVAKGDVPALLRSLAQSNGLVVSEEGGLMRIEVADAQRTAAARTGAPASGQEMRLYVYRLRHARAPKLAGTLQSLFGGARGAGQGSGSRPTLSEGLRSFQIPPLATPDAPSLSATREPPQPAAATSLPGQLQGDVQIVPEETTNSLLVRASPADWAVINQAILSLDLRPLQVIIEVLIAEVRHTDDFKLGVSVAGTNTDARRAVSLGGEPPGANDFVVKLLYNDPDIAVTLSALAAKGNVRIVSRPVLFAQNNLEARILVGSERPFVQVSRSLPTDAAIRDQVIQYRDVGTKLSITPTINPDGYVNLQVTQEVSTATNETQFGAPIISTREASTHIFVRDGRTGVIGGLVDREQDHSRSGIPFLSDIPYLGFLFGTTKNTTLTSELFLFLTPHIVASDEDAERVRGEIEGRTPATQDAKQGNPAVLPTKP
jgi:general secretion pathway protein D